ncbi:hypothetical protein [Anaerotruncus sp. AF02-27]|uniref:hypothetical protein n=1 Tax=Anaerotruncus sp. AF02-27 TaxID=2292191 RepID=UPI0011C2228B|nr:hypothetical protein [Anaerotruncus sp. AF02-27]
MGRFYGSVEVDEIHELNYGEQGVTRVGIKRIQTTPEEKERIRNTLISIAKHVIETLPDDQEEGKNAEQNGHDGAADGQPRTA